MTLVESLQTPFTAPKLAALEQLRAAVMAHVFPAGSASDTAARVFGWVMQSDLRGFFPGLTPINGIFPDGPNTLDLAYALGDAVPRLEKLGPALQAIGLSEQNLALLERYIKNDLPQRRIEGYCALACICALERTDL